MQKLFLQLYVRLVFGLIVISVGSIGLLLSLAITRFDNYVMTHSQPIVQLASRNWNLLSDEEQTQWLDLLSTLTDATWTLSERRLINPILIQHSDWTKRVAYISVRLSEFKAADIRIEKWAEWHSGYGWLLLNALSNVPASERESLFNEINEIARWPAKRVNQNEQSLSELALLQLNNGQHIRVDEKHGDGEIYYYPAGAEQVICIGPIPSFSFLSTQQWLMVVAFNLAVLTFILAWLVRPLHVRIAAISEGVERIYDNESNINLPGNHNDDLGLLAIRIEEMARRLLMQVEQNLQLNQAVSHDLKTPLARMKFALSLAEQDPTPDQFERLNHEVDLLTELTNELLIFHQLGATKSHSQATTDSAAVLKRIIRPYQTNGIELTFAIDSYLPSVNIDEAHWRRVCQNLLDNAEQYGNGKIHVTLQRDKRELQLTVADNGPGLTLEAYQSLKQPFSRGDKSRNLNSRNHGLGLSLVHAITEHYAGSVDLTESSLAGACFIIKLPIEHKV
jgi:signal transduction histidine kinase